MCDATNMVTSIGEDTNDQAVCDTLPDDRSQVQSLPLAHHDKSSHVEGKI